MNAPAPISLVTSAKAASKNNFVHFERLHSGRLTLIIGRTSTAVGGYTLIRVLTSQVTVEAT
jgi:hypothetical protein